MNSYFWVKCSFKGEKSVTCLMILRHIPRPRQEHGFFDEDRAGEQDIPACANVIWTVCKKKKQENVTQETKHAYVKHMRVKTADEDTHHISCPM